MNLQARTHLDTPMAIVPPPGYIDQFMLECKGGIYIYICTPRSLYTLLHLCMSLFCLLRVLLFALGRVLT
jgi:hypothetical protein